MLVYRLLYCWNDFRGFQDELLQFLYNVFTRRKYKINFILYCFRRDILYKISKNIDKGNLTYSCLFCDTQINTYTIYFWKWISGFAVQKNWKEYGRNFIKKMVQPTRGFGSMIWAFEEVIWYFVIYKYFKNILFCFL